MAGTVVTASVDPGQVLAQGVPLLTLAPAKALVVALGVQPEAIGAVRTGQSVALSDALDPAVHLSGTVASIGARVDARSRLVKVTVALSVPAAAADLPLLGRFVAGQIAVRAARVVAVPRGAVLQDNQGAYLFVIRQGAAHRVAVSPGLETEKRVAVGSAVKPGTPVVIEGNYELQNGMAVREVTP